MIKTYYVKYKEIIMYLIFGVAATAVNWLVYSVSVRWLGFSTNGGNITAWFISVMFAFVTNKTMVFESRNREPSVILGEMAKFFGARILTGVIEILGLPFLIRVGVNQPLFGVEGFLAKIIVSIIVIILNYVFSKLFVFAKKEK